MFRRCLGCRLSWDRRLSQLVLTSYLSLKSPLEAQISWSLRLPSPLRHRTRSFHFDRNATSQVVSPHQPSRRRSCFESPFRSNATIREKRTRTRRTDLPPLPPKTIIASVWLLTAPNHRILVFFGSRKSSVPNGGGGRIRKIVYCWGTLGSTG